MCAIVDNFIEQGVEKGKREGLEQGMRDSICAVADVFSLKELSQRFKLSEEKILQILSSAGITPKLAD